MNDRAYPSYRRRLPGVRFAALALILTIGVISILAADGLPNSAAVNAPEAATPDTMATAGQADDSYRYYPAYIGNILYFRAYKKSEPGKQLFVKVQVIGTEKRDKEEYFYFSGPGVNVRYLMSVDKKDGVYIRVIKYPFPLFGFSINVDLKPRIQILKFPLKAGEKWHYEGKARARPLFIPITRNIKADFELVERVTMKTPVGDIDTYHMKAVLDLDDGKGAVTEHYWYAKDIGYAIGDTEGHRAEIAGYRIFNEAEGKWMENLPQDAEKYK